MKTLKDFILEGVLPSASDILSMYMINYKSAQSLVEEMEKDGWILDENFNNWSGGEFVEIRMYRKTEIVWITFEDVNQYHGGDIRKVLPNLYSIIESKYRKFSSQSKLKEYFKYY